MIFFLEENLPGRFVRITAEQQQRMDDEMDGSTSAKRTRRMSYSDRRRTGESVDIPPTMQQAFLSLEVHSKRRSETDLAAMSMPEIEVYLERLEGLWAEIEQEWRALRSSIYSGTEMSCIVAEYARHSDIYMGLKSALRARLVAAQANNWPTLANTTTSAAGQTIQIQLAEPANIPQFSGRDEDWAHFRSAFVAEVHSSSRFNNSQKLRHLLGAIRGRARDILGSWTPDCGESYMQAWQGLCNSYDNEYNTIQAHLRKIDSLHKVQRPTGTAVRDVLDTVRSAHRQLRLLLTPELVADHLLMHRIEAALDSETLSQWSLRRLPSTLPTLNQMYEFLELRASALFGMLGESGRTNDNQRSRGFAASSTTAPRTGRGDEPRPKCELCANERHWPFACPKFKALALRERWAYVNERKMCGNCFSSRHKTSDCSDKKCPRCIKLHNSCLCPSNANIGNHPNSSRRPIEISNTGTAAGATGGTQ